MVLKVRDCPILVRANGDQPRIDVEVEGPSALRRSALNVVLDDFEAVHKLNPECGPEARVPFPGRPEKDIGYEYLRDLEERYGLDHQFFPEGADRDYTVGELLEGVRRERTPFAGRRELTSGPHPKAGVDLHVVILVHGIRTRAIWQSSIRDSLENYGFIVELTNYGYFDLVRFLLPFSVLRRKPVDNITRQLRDIVKMNPQSSVSVIAHSFGTFVISEIMRRHPDINFHKVIFCGSVVKYNFPFDEFSHRFDTPIINEVGTRDVWPALAEAITWGYGSAGTYGFRRPRVRDRWHIGKHTVLFSRRSFVIHIGFLS